MVKGLTELLAKNKEISGQDVSATAGFRKIKAPNVTQLPSRTGELFVPGHVTDMVAGRVRQKEPIADFNLVRANQHDYTKVRRTRDRYFKAVPIIDRRKDTIRDE